MNIHIYIYTYKRVHIYIYAYIYACTYMYIYICVYTSIHYVRVVYWFRCQLYARIYTVTPICLSFHTHTHTHPVICVYTHTHVSIACGNYFFSKKIFISCGNVDEKLTHMIHVWHFYFLEYVQQGCVCVHWFQSISVYTHEHTCMHTDVYTQTPNSVNLHVCVRKIYVPK